MKKMYIVTYMKDNEIKQVRIEGKELAFKELTSLFENKTITMIHMDKSK